MKETKRQTKKYVPKNQMEAKTFGEKFRNLIGQSNSIDKAFRALKPRLEDLEDSLVDKLLICAEIKETRYVMSDGKLDAVWVIVLYWVDLTETFVLFDRKNLEIFKAIQARKEESSVKSLSKSK